jgi:hypothetical protein
LLFLSSSFYILSLESSRDAALSNGGQAGFAFARRSWGVE